VSDPTPFEDVDAIATTKASRRSTTDSMEDLKGIGSFSLGGPEFKHVSRGCRHKKVYGIKTAVRQLGWASSKALAWQGHTATCSGPTAAAGSTWC